MWQLCFFFPFLFFFFMAIKKWHLNSDKQDKVTNFYYYLEIIRLGVRVRYATRLFIPHLQTHVLYQIFSSFLMWWVRHQTIWTFGAHRINWQGWYMYLKEEIQIRVSLIMVPRITCYHSSKGVNSPSPTQKCHVPVLWSLHNVIFSVWLKKGKNQPISQIKGKINANKPTIIICHTCYIGNLTIKIKILAYPTTIISMSLHFVPAHLPLDEREIRFHKKRGHIHDPIAK